MRTTIPLLLLAFVGAARAEERPFLGVSLAPIDAETREAFEISADVTAGVLLTEITEGSAAAGAGFRKGDVLIAFDGKEIEGPDHVVELVRGKKPGDRVTYVLRRGTGRIEGTLVLGLRREVEVEVAEEPPAHADELEGRIEAARKRVQEMRRRLDALAKSRAKAKSAAAPRGLQGYLHREELAREKAAAEGKPATVAYHEARIDLLRELIRDRGDSAQLDRIEAGIQKLLAAREK